jgi:hypothetical protein
MMDRHQPQPPRRDVENREILAALSGLVLPKFEVYAARQLQEMSGRGALLAETIDPPVLVKNPLAHPTDVAIITSRWLGGGIFGVVFPLPNGALESGFISIRDTLAVNPALTPSGTVVPQRWDQNVVTKRDHLLPRLATVMEAVRSVSRALAAKLLERHPHRIDLTIRTDTPLAEIKELLEFSRSAILPLQKELLGGLAANTNLSGEDRLLGRAVELRYIPKIQKIALEQALTLFKESRLRDVRSKIEGGQSVGIVSELIEHATTAASRATPLFRDLILRDPFGTPSSATLRDAARAGIEEVTTHDREFQLLWRLLGARDRAKISKIIGNKAWLKAISDQAQTN